MKLVEIKDVRPGQVWKDDESYLVLIGTDLKGTWYNSKGVSCMGGMELCDTVHCKLTGFLGITHRIEGNRLVEIPRESLIIDDVVEYLDFDGFPVKGVICAVITAMVAEETQYEFITEDGKVDDSSLFDREEIREDSGIYTYTPQKIGILGVTHEFINDREVENV